MILEEPSITFPHGFLDLKADYFKPKTRAQKADAWVQAIPRKAPNPGFTLSALKKALPHAKTALLTNDWTKANPSIFVGSFVIWHREIYGAEPVELMEGTVESQKIRTNFRFQTTTVLDKRFQDATGEMAEFYRWSFEREVKRSEQIPDYDMRLTPANFFQAKRFADFLVRKR